MKTEKRFAFFPLCLLSVLFLACTNEGYDVGNGTYSNVHADFSMLSTDAKGRVASFVTDGEKNYNLNPPTAFFKAKSDTVYRALVYYEKTNDGYAKVMGLRAVGVARPFSMDKNPVKKQDPVDLISAWISSNGAYINFVLGLKKGVGDDEDNNSHVIGFGISAPKTVGSPSKREFTLTLFHDQNGVPESYTSTEYISVPLKKSFVSGDVLKVIIQTYGGKVTKSFVVP